MKKRTLYLCVFLVLAALLVAAVLCITLPEAAEPVGEHASVLRPPQISPDYADTVIPPNLAPLNFVIREPGEKYCVRISSTHGGPIEIFSRNPDVVIPVNPWHALLDVNRGEKVTFDVYVRSDLGRWLRFEPITSTIARDDIDAYLVYREMPVYNLAWTDMGIYQRHLENYDESVVLHNSSFGHGPVPAYGCCNCHTFLNNRPASIVMNVRSNFLTRKPPGGMLITQDDSVLRVVDTKSRFSSVPAIYLAWHPSGKAIAFSTNNVLQCFHTVGYNRDTYDSFSDVALYLIDSNTVTTVPDISSPDHLETYPTWTPDGRTLYYCSAPQLPVERYREIRYSLMRISYDIESDTWGKPETVIDADRTGLSAALPRISPDGKFLLLCMLDYGNFAAFSPSSDLYMLDTRSGKLTRLDSPGVNSEHADSFHSWSSNSRWFVFSSKKMDGLFTRLYLSYVDETGKAHKAVLMPQKDPRFYESYIRIYNVPELIREPVPVSERELVRALYTPAKNVKAHLDPRVIPPSEAGKPEAPPKDFQ